MSAEPEVDGFTLLLLSAPWVYGTNNYTRILQDFLKIDIEEIDTDARPDLADKYKVAVLPTIIVEDNNTEILRFTGFTDVPFIRKSLEKVGIT